MESTYIDLSYFQVGIAACLVILNGVISYCLGLKLERSLLVSSLRMTLQLLLVGLILQWVFTLSEWYLVVGLMTIMTTIAGVTAVERVVLKYKGIIFTSLFSVWTSSWFLTTIALFVIVQVKPWYSPQYAIPLLGMILGNILNGISIGLERFTSDLSSKKEDVECLLSLGASRWEAARLLVSDSVRAGLVPIINMMMVAGIVSLPGMMTGQLLAGVEPISAVKYQIVIIFLISVATAFGTTCSVLMSFQKLFNDKHQFLFDRLE